MNSTEFWRNVAMALVNRTASKQLNITQKELDKAAQTDNSLIIDNGKYTIQAGGLRSVEDEG